MYARDWLEHIGLCLLIGVLLLVACWLWTWYVLPYVLLGVLWFGVPLAASLA